MSIILKNSGWLGSCELAVDPWYNKNKTTNFRRSTGGDNSIGDVHFKERTPEACMLPRRERVRSCDGSALHRGGWAAASGVWEERHGDRRALSKTSSRCASGENSPLSGGGRAISSLPCQVLSANRRGVEQDHQWDDARCYLTRGAPPVASGDACASHKMRRNLAEDCWTAAGFCSDETSSACDPAWAMKLLDRSLVGI